MLINKVVRYVAYVIRKGWRTRRLLYKQLIKEYISRDICRNTLYNTLYRLSYRQYITYKRVFISNI